MRGEGVPPPLRSPAVMPRLYSFPWYLISNLPLQGLPVDRWTRLQSVMALHGMGLHWGRARPQNKKAHLVGGSGIEDHGLT